MREPLHASNDLESLPVYDAEGVPIGTTFGVLSEIETGLVRFFDVSIDDRQRHVLVPTGHARLEQVLGKLRLRLRAATVDQLEDIPAYEPHIAWPEDDFQNELLTSFGRLFDGQRYYAHPAYDHTGLYAGTHPLLRDPLSPLSPEGLHRLSCTSDFKVAEGEHDIRGWDLMGAGGRRVGRATDLIIDTAAEQVRYVVVQREVDEKETLLPVGYVDIGDDAVHTELSGDDLLALPVFEGTALDREGEATLRVALDVRLRNERKFLRADFRSAA